MKVETSLNAKQLRVLSANTLNLGNHITQELKRLGAPVLPSLVPSFDTAKISGNASINYTYISSSDGVGLKVEACWNPADDDDDL